LLLGCPQRALGRLALDGHTGDHGAELGPARLPFVRLARLVETEHEDRHGLPLGADHRLDVAGQDPMVQTQLAPILGVFAIVGDVGAHNGLAATQYRADGVAGLIVQGQRLQCMGEGGIVIRRH